MQKILEKLPPLINSDDLKNTLNDGFKISQTYRLLEANFGSVYLEDFNK